MEDKLKYNAKTRQEIKEWIEENGLVELHGAKITTFCERFGIAYKTYQRWMEKPEFKELVDNARAVFKENLPRVLINSLVESAKGGYHEQVETTFIPDKNGKGEIKLQKKKRVWTPPNVASAIFLLTNLDPEHWQQRRTENVSVKTEDTGTQMTQEEINEELERLQKFQDPDTDTEPEDPETSE